MSDIGTRSRKEEAGAVGEYIRIDEAELYVEQVGLGRDVLLLAGLGDPLEAWQAQLETLAERHRLTAFDNRGVGRTRATGGPVSTAGMADDAAGLLRALKISRAHVVGNSMGGAIAQELALRHPELVRSLVLVSTYAQPDAFFRAQLDFWRWLPETAPNKRAFLEGFFTWVYTPRAHADGTVADIVEQALAFPHWWSIEAFQAQVDACREHDTACRLAEISAPTLVLAGGLDAILPPRFGRRLAEGIPGARLEVLVEEAHKPFQERPRPWNSYVEAFWRSVEDAPRRWFSWGKAAN